jgi:EamA domain-containing membrane protein RarD
MITLILSIIFWCKPDNRKLGIAALILSLVGFIVDIFLTGWLSIIDLVVAGVNAFVLYKHKDYY